MLAVPDVSTYEKYDAYYGYYSHEFKRWIPGSKNTKEIPAMILKLADGSEVTLDGQFGTAKRKLAEMSGHVEKGEDGKVTEVNVTELKTDDGHAIAIAPPGSAWLTLTKESKE